MKKGKEKIEMRSVGEHSRTIQTVSALDIRAIWTLAFLECTSMIAYLSLICKEINQASNLVMFIS